MLACLPWYRPDVSLLHSSPACYLSPCCSNTCPTVCLTILYAAFALLISACLLELMCVFLGLWSLGKHPLVPVYYILSSDCWLSFISASVIINVFYICVVYLSLTCACLLAVVWWQLLGLQSSCNLYCKSVVVFIEIDSENTIIFAPCPWKRKRNLG